MLSSRKYRRMIAHSNDSTVVSAFFEVIAYSMKRSDREESLLSSREEE